MTCELSRRADRGIIGAVEAADDSLDLASRDCSQAKQHRLFRIESDHGGFEPERGGTGIKDELDLAAQALAHMLRGRGTDASGGVGARSSNRQSGYCQKLLSRGVCGYTEGNGAQSPADQLRQGTAGVSRKNQCQRAGPEDV